MADLTSERDRRVREYLAKKSEGRNPNNIGIISRGQAEIQNIQSELGNDLALQRVQDQARLRETGVMAQAAEGLLSMENPESNQILSQQVGGMNQDTQNIMSKYGIKPENTRKVSSNSSRSVSGAWTTNIRTENITNNRTEIKITQPQIPISQPKIITTAPKQQTDNTTKFRAWLSGMFARQQNEAEIAKKEYRKKEWNLARTTSRILKRIEESTVNLSNRLDPKRVTDSLGGQLKWLLLLFGATLITKVWKPVMGVLTNIESGFRAAFGLPMNSKLEQNGAQGISIVDKIKKFIGIKDSKTTLIDGIGTVFMQGINKLIDKLKFWFEDRAGAIRDLKFPEIKTPSFDNPLFGSLMSGITDSLKGVGQYLGEIITVALGGSKGLVKSASNRIRKSSVETFKSTEGKKKYSGDDGLMNGSGRSYMRESDFGVGGILKGNASSTHAMSRTLNSLFDNKTSTSYSAELASGVQQIFDVARRNGKVIIDPEFLKNLGIDLNDINQLKARREIIQVPYKIIQVHPSRAQYIEEGNGTSIGTWLGAGGGIVSGASAGAGLGSFLGPVGTAIGGAVGAGVGAVAGSSLGRYTDELLMERGRKKSLVSKLVPIDSNEVSDDGSPAVRKMMFALTKKGADWVADKFMSGAKNKEASLMNQEFLDKIRAAERKRKRANGVTGPLKENQDLRFYNSSQSRYKNYLEQYHWNFVSKDPNSINTKKYGSFNTFSDNLENGIEYVRTIAANGIRYFTPSYSYGGGRGRCDKEEGKRRVKVAMEFFMDKGLTKAQAAGIVGNLAAEGLFVKDLGSEHEDNGGPSAGIAQFHDKRGEFGELSRLKKFARDNGLELNKLETQLEYLWSGNSPDANKTIALVRSLQGDDKEVAIESSRLWGRHYEKFQGHEDFSTKTYKDRAEFSLGYLNSSPEESIPGYREEGKIEKILDDAGNAIADFIDPNSDKDKNNPLLNKTLTKEQQEILEKEIKRQISREDTNKSLWESIGAKTDSRGTYFQQGNLRAYLKTDGNHNGLFGVSDSDIDYIYMSDENGNTLRNLEDSEYELAKSTILTSIEHSISDYPEKEKGQGYYDYISDDKGNPIGYSIGKFTDLGNFTDVAKKDFGGEIEFIIYPTKDLKGYNIIGIRPTGVRCSLELSLDNKERVYGPIIYHKGAKWKSLTKKDEYVDRQPICILCRVSLTPLATLEATKLISLLRDLGEITRKGYEFYKSDGTKLTREELEKAKKYGIISNGFGVSDVTNKYKKTLAESSKISDPNSKFNRYFTEGLNISGDKASREKYYNENKENFTRANGFLYDSSNLKWGTVDDKGNVNFYDDETFNKINRNGVDDVDSLISKQYSEKLDKVSDNALGKFLLGANILEDFDPEGGIKSNFIFRTSSTGIRTLRYGGGYVNVPYGISLTSDGKVSGITLTREDLKRGLEDLGIPKENIESELSNYSISKEKTFKTLKDLDKYLLGYFQNLRGNYNWKLDSKEDPGMVLYQEALRKGKKIRDIRIGIDHITGTYEDGEPFKVRYSVGSLNPNEKERLIKKIKSTVNSLVDKRASLLRKKRLAKSYEESDIGEEFKKLIEKANKGELKYSIDKDTKIARNSFGMAFAKEENGKLIDLSADEIYNQYLPIISESGSTENFYKSAFGKSLKRVGGKNYLEIDGKRVEVDLSSGIDSFLRKGLSSLAVGGNNTKVQINKDGVWKDSKDSSNLFKEMNKSLQEQIKDSSFKNFLNIFQNLDKTVSTGLSKAAKDRIEQYKEAIEQNKTLKRSEILQRMIAEKYVGKDDLENDQRLADLEKDYNQKLKFANDLQNIMTTTDSFSGARVENIRSTSLNFGKKLGVKTVYFNADANNDGVVDEKDDNKRVKVYDEKGKPISYVTIGHQGDNHYIINNGKTAHEVVSLDGNSNSKSSKS